MILFNFHTVQDEERGGKMDAPMNNELNIIRNKSFIYDTVEAKGTFATHPFFTHISPYRLLFFCSTQLPPLLQDTNPP